MGDDIVRMLEWLAMLCRVRRELFDVYWVISRELCDGAWINETLLEIIG